MSLIFICKIKKKAVNQQTFSSRKCFRELSKYNSPKDHMKPFFMMKMLTDVNKKKIELQKICTVKDIFLLRKRTVMILNLA